MMTAPGVEKIRDSDWRSTHFDVNVEQGMDSFDPTRFQRIGTTAVVFLSKSQYKPLAETIPRGGRPLAELHNGHNALTHEQGEPAPRGTIMDFKLEADTIGYNCSQAFEQLVENEAGELEARWYIALRTEKVGAEISRIGFYYQPKGDSTTPPEGGTWRLDVARQLSYDSMRYVEDEGPWKPDSNVFFLRPNLKNANAIELLPSPDNGHEIPTAPEAHQDPSVALGSINGEPLVVMTAVKAVWFRSLASERNAKRMSYHQEFFIGDSVGSMEKIAVGPAHRKGTRVTYLGDNRWSVFNRPQGNYQPGVITYAEFTANSREEFIQEFEKAILDISTVIPDLCQPDEWVGPNFAWPLKDSKIGVIGHLAAMLNKATGEREYSAMSFVYDPATNTAQEVQVIATKEAFEGLVGRRVERDDLDNVIYPGGAVLLPNGKLRLYCGVSDLSAGYVDIDDPFASQRG